MPLGNLTSKTDRKSQTILYVYDALNRLSHKGYPDATGVDYVYDLAGKIHRSPTPPAGTALLRQHGPADRDHNAVLVPAGKPHNILERLWL